jgi:restriction system protein
MATTRYRWHRVIANSYLGTTKVIRGATKAEVEQKAAQQLATWAQQAAQRQQRYQAQLSRQAQQDQLRALEAQAAAENDEAQARLAALNSLLHRGIANGKRFRWDELKQLRPYPSFQFQVPPPAYEQVTQSLGVPAQRAVLEGLFRGIRRKREELEAKARSEYDRATAQYEARKMAAFHAYEEQRLAYERGRNDYNASIDDKRKRFEAGDAEAAVWFLQLTLNNLVLPEEYGKDFDIAFDVASGTAVINMQLPTLEEVPRISGYKFVKTRRAIDPVELKQKEFDALYDSLIHQMALLTIHRVFREAYSPAVQAVVFNGWVTGVDRKTGHDFTSCILSVQASRTAFQTLNLERVDPKECVRNLKGIVAGPLAQLAPVKPIMDLNREDKRFIESREILANLNATDNLATMDWEDFEHLVRELFGKVFGGEGQDVRITQASRDRGVDAIAFDPDPIRGGKFVIQAKRYNNVVPVSAVRDLYGTMIAEGAVKGILVTTSHYGNDSREFAKDKPITLIDGSNLVHMFQQHGYEVKIELQ